jgi:hypothetical protein
MQAPSQTTVDIPQSIKDSLRKFRFARRSEGSAALVIKINKAKLIMEEVEQFDSISLEELAEGAHLPNPYDLPKVLITMVLTLIRFCCIHGT